MKRFKQIFLCVFHLLNVILAIGTFVEQRHGSDYAQENIYHAYWFCALWAVVAIMGLWAIIKECLWKRFAVFTLHVALLTILAGAFTSFLTSKSGMMHIGRGESSNMFYVRGNSQPEALPLTLQLDSFQIQYYSGTMAPSDFVSYIHYKTDDKGEPQTAIISMNNIFTHKGYRFYQSSYDPDLQGTVLTVTYDAWGTMITYFGYALLALSMICVLLSRHEEFRRILRHPQLRQGGLFLFLLCCQPLTSSARESIPTINREKAKEMGRMQVMYNDRVVPLNTLSCEFLRKIYGRDTYRGLSSEQVLAGWMARPATWKEQPMIKIKQQALRDSLGIEGNYARFADLFDGQTYKLLALPAQTDNPPSLAKAIRELDEKVGLIVMAANGDLVRPIPPEVTPLSESRVDAELLLNRIPFTKLLFIVNLTLGFLSFFLMIFGTLRKRPAIYRGLTALFAIALLFHTTGYLLRWYVSGRVPLGNGYETMLFMAWAIMLITCILLRRFRFILPFGYLISGFTLLVSYLGQMNPQITPLMPVLNSPLLSAHVSIIMIAYALLAFLMFNGLLAVWLIFRHKDKGDIEQQLIQITLLSRLMLYPAVFLLAIGIFIGAVWANVSWGKYWSWDPKEVWALITLLVYSVAFHDKSLPWLRKPLGFHAYMVFAFLMVLMTYFGVNYFLGGMHSYA